VNETTSLKVCSQSCGRGSGVGSQNFLKGKNIWAGLKCLILGEQQYFCLERRFSKRKITRYAKNFGGMSRPATLMMHSVRKISTAILKRKKMKKRLFAQR